VVAMGKDYLRLSLRIATWDEATTVVSVLPHHLLPNHQLTKAIYRGESHVGGVFGDIMVQTHNVSFDYISPFKSTDFG
jgi:hypothetical protein